MSDLTLAYSLYILQLFQRNREIGSHLLDADILEDDVRRTTKFLADLLAQVFQHDAQRLVKGADGCLMLTTCLIVIAELVVFDNHERLWILDELLASRCQFQQTVVLDILFQVSCQHSLTDNGVPQFFLIFLTGTKQFMILVFVGQYLLRLAASHKVYHIVSTEVLFQRMNGIQYDDQQFMSLHLLLRVQAVVAVMAVVLMVFLTEIVKQHLSPTHRSLSIGSGF